MGIGISAAKLRRDRLLVPSVPKREQETDGDRLGVELRERREIEWFELAVSRDAAAYADTALERRKWFWVLGARSIKVGAGLTSQMENVFEAGSGYERRPHPTPLEQSVRGDRRSVREAVDLARADSRGRREHRLLLMLTRGHFGGSHLAVRDEHGVGEGPTHVDSKRTHSAILGERAE